MGNTDLSGILGVDADDPAIQAIERDVEALMSAIYDLVRERRRRGLTQRDVAKAMNTTQSSVSDFERVFGDPRVSTLQRYARAVGASVKLVVAIEGQDSQSTEAAKAASTSWTEAGVIHPDAVGV